MTEVNLTLLYLLHVDLHWKHNYNWLCKRMIVCFKTAHITRPIRTWLVKYMCTIPKNIIGTVMEDTLTNWPRNCPCYAGTSGELYCFICMPLLDAISDQFCFFSREIACRVNFEFKNLPFAIANEPSPWCVFFSINSCKVMICIVANKL